MLILKLWPSPKSTPPACSTAFENLRDPDGSMIWLKSENLDVSCAGSWPPPPSCASDRPPGGPLRPAIPPRLAPGSARGGPLGLFRLMGGRPARRAARPSGPAFGPTAGGPAAPGIGWPIDRMACCRSRAPIDAACGFGPTPLLAIGLGADERCAASLPSQQKTKLDKQPTLSILACSDGGRRVCNCAGAPPPPPTPPMPIGARMPMGPCSPRGGGRPGTPAPAGGRPAMGPPKPAGRAMPPPATPDCEC